ncbi:Nuclear apoptosis-inducing factor 1 [Liparis tanakae]|uniref:Nuclear apoptosis-inducing factor 1 n=1 Tax=Liparis tanakae TaxID=230148 RepID=A0A4Z2EUT3_9TELE|nr:Nuclear apoptosis-inducing factor 1 [Liparis tanakae]
MASIAKKRKMNFSEREVEIIVEEIEKQKHTLVNHFNAGVTHMAKNGAWLDILKKVNAVTTCPRELPEVKKKWSDMKTEVRRKVAQARAAIEGTATDCTPVPVILTAMQQRICNLLGEATIISLPAGDSDPELSLPVTVTTTVTLAETLPGGSVCEEVKPANETTYHTLEDGGVVEYCTTTVSDSAPSEAPAEAPAASSASPPPPQAKPQELKSRIALNSARLLQEQRVTNVHIRQIAQHLEGQNELLLLMRRSQEAQAFAQERQAQALEGTQAALLALVQMLRPALKDLRKFLQSGTEGAGGERAGGERAGGERAGGERTGAERTGSERTGGERAGGERTGGERAGGERTGGERAGGERTGGERTGGEGTGAEGTRAEGTGGERAGGERTGGERTRAERTGSERTGGEGAGGEGTGAERTRAKEQGRPRTPPPQP